MLPAPLDTALLAEFSPTSPLTLLDRASAIGLLACWADFGQEDEASWRRYDDVSAEEMFKEYGGVSDTLYDELVAPLLHVLPMGPGYDISAAAALSCFHVFALQVRIRHIRCARVGASALRAHLPSPDHLRALPLPDHLRSRAAPSTSAGAAAASRRRSSARGSSGSRRAATWSFRAARA